MTYSSFPLAIAVIAAAAVVVVVSVLLVGRIAERFGEDPHWWQLRMLPFTAFGPFLAWMILSRRSGGGRGGFA